MTNTEDQLRGSLHARAERAAYEPTPWPTWPPGRG